MPRRTDEQPYSKVVRETWGDARFKALTSLKPSGQGLWLYLLTGPHCTVIPGLFPQMGIGTLADRLKWPYATVERHWSEIADQEMAEADWSAGVIWLPKAINHNEPASLNVVKAWRNVPLPQCDLVVRALRILRARLAAKPNQAWVEVFDEGFGKAFPRVMAQGLPQGKPEGIPQGLTLAYGYTETGTETGTDHSPQPPAVAGGMAREVKVVRADRQEAKVLRDALRNGCEHEPRCPTVSICIEYIAVEIAKRRLEARRLSA